MKKGGGLLWDVSLSPGNSIVSDGFVLWNVRHKVVFIRMDIYSNGFVLCSSISVFVCGSSYFALTLTDESNIGHVMRMLQSSVLLTFLRRSHQVTQYKEINSNQKPAFLKACVVLAWQVFFSPRNKIVQQMWKPEMI